MWSWGGLAVSMISCADDAGTGCVVCDAVGMLCVWYVCRYAVAGCTGVCVMLLSGFPNPHAACVHALVCNMWPCVPAMGMYTMIRAGMECCTVTRQGGGMWIGGGPNCCMLSCWFGCSCAFYAADLSATSMLYLLVVMSLSSCCTIGLVQAAVDVVVLERWRFSAMFARGRCCAGRCKAPLWRGSSVLYFHIHTWSCCDV